MSRIQSIQSLLVVAVFSFLGGIVGGWFFQPPVADAKKEIRRINADIGHINSLYVKQLVVGDNDGHIFGSFEYIPGDGAVLAMYSEAKSTEVKSRVCISKRNGGGMQLAIGSSQSPELVLASPNNEGLIQIRDKDNLRIQMGTNHIQYRASGKEEIRKGSLFFYNNNSQVVGLLPK